MLVNKTSLYTFRALSIYFRSFAELQKCLDRRNSRHLANKNGSNYSNF